MRSAVAARPTLRVAVGAAVRAVLALLVVGVLGGCGRTGASSPPTTTVVPQSGTVGVQALDNRFEPKAVTITVGSTVTWTNDGSNTHDVVPAEGSSFGVRPEAFEPDATYSATFTSPGTFVYYCSLHGTATRGMTATVVVVAH